MQAAVVRQNEASDQPSRPRRAVSAGVLPARIKPAVTATTFTGEKSSKNAGYVDAVARTNVSVTLDNSRRRSPILADLEKKGSIRIAGAMYDLAPANEELFAS
jgi:carbonic anhydrase